MNYPRTPTNSAQYNARPISSLGALARALATTEDVLLDLALRADGLYRVAKRIPKADGSVRIVLDALPELKFVHKKIKKLIFDKVSFPTYLHGSTKGCDFKTNALQHVGARIIITEDIGSFFPSTKHPLIHSIWSGFFGFSFDVAECLSRLTTLRGELPQGAVTSPDLANLVFWKTEPDIYEFFHSKGFVYSRFVDDIAVSSKLFMPAAIKTDCIGKIYGMMIAQGYQPKRGKHKVYTSSNRMVVTQLGVNSKPGLEPQKRSNIRAMVHRLENAPNDVARQEIHKVSGQIAFLKRFHPGEAASLGKRVEARKTELLNCD